jgi:hypothetical protein
MWPMSLLHFKDGIVHPTAGAKALGVRVLHFPAQLAQSVTRAIRQFGSAQWVGYACKRIGYWGFGTGAIGSVTVTADANISVTGFPGRDLLVQYRLRLTPNTTVTGVSATGAVGSVTVTADANIAVTGVSATSAVGTVTTRTDNVLPVTGVSATGSIGTVSFIGNVVIIPTGVSGQGEVAQVLVWGPIIPGQDANWQAIDESQTANWSKY